jgi:transcriptional regulator with XRE-family HTH domain
MEDNNKKHSDIDALLGNLFKPENLRDLFDKRVYELGLSERDVRRMLKIEYRTINGIIDGTQKRGDISSFKKLAAFLNMPLDEFLEMHSSLVEANSSDKNTITNKKKFIKDNFDLAVLKKAGFINSITDFEEIEKRLISYFNLSSIFEYEKRSFNTAFSAPTITARKPEIVEEKIAKSNPTRDFWLTSAKTLATKIDNPYSYDRKSLIDFFPQIKWFSTNEDLGLVNVIKSLFRIGITVIFQPTLSILYLRGATLSVNGKPVVVLTDYKGFYPTIWHALVHELYHVLFDWEKINSKQAFRVTNDNEEIVTMEEDGIEADDFARKYFFSKEKSKEVSRFIYNEQYIKNVAKDNNVHSSIIHAYHAFDNGATDRMAWARARRSIPDAKKCVYRVANYWDNAKPLDEIAKKLKSEIYN